MKQVKLSEREREHIIAALLVVSLVTQAKGQIGTLRRLAGKILASLEG